MRTMRAGGVGCISATANVNPKAIATLAANWQAAGADQHQAELDQVRAIFQKYQMIAALKTAVAHFSKDADWLRIRPPLMPLGADQQKKLITELEQIHFSMPGL
jgi:4-hydroxy-tetrahydrodipicolinate synthase